MKLLNRDEYYKERKNISDKSKCVFCYKEQIVLGEYDHWVWIATSAPYWKYHTMLVPKRHIVEIYEINDREWVELKKLEKSIVKKYKSIRVTGEDTTKQLENVLIFFRHRLNLKNTVSNIKNLEHLHLHFTFDKEHFLDPISDKNASDWDPRIFIDKQSM